MVGYQSKRRWVPAFAGMTIWRESTTMISGRSCACRFFLVPHRLRWDPRYKSALQFQHQIDASPSSDLLCMRSFRADVYLCTRPNGWARSLRNLLWAAGALVCPILNGARNAQVLVLRQNIFLHEQTHSVALVRLGQPLICQLAI